MNKYRIVEFLCLISVIVFIVFSFDDDKKTDKSAGEIINSLLPCCNFTQCYERENEEIRNTFGFDLTCFDSVAYYSSDDIMDVSEIFVAVTNDNTDVNYIVNELKDYKNDRYNIYNGYAPMQASLCDSALILTEHGVVLFYIGENSDEVTQSFNKVLSEVN